MGGRDRGDSRSRYQPGRQFTLDERSLAPIVAIVILFGLVIIGAALLFIPGMEAVEMFQSQSEREQALASIQETDQRIWNAIGADQSQELPLEEGSITDDGSVTIIWHDGDPSQGNETVEVEPLGAIEFAAGDVTMVHQGGGIFEHHGDYVLVHSGPDVRYENQTLTLQFLQIDASATGGSGGIAEPDYSEGQSVAQEIENASTQGYSDVTIVIESSYYEGWYEHMSVAMNEETDENVTVEKDPDEQRVVTDISNFTVDRPHLNVTDFESDGIVVRDDQLEVTATVKNEGGATANGEPVELIVEGQQLDSQDITLDAGDETTVEFTVPASELPAYDDLWMDLEQYGEQEFAVRTEQSEATSGFAFVADRTVYMLRDVSHDVEDYDSVVTLDVQNVGNEGEARDVNFTIEADDPDVQDLLDDVEWEPEDLSLDAWEVGNASFAVNRSMLPDANYTYTIEIDNEPGEPCNLGTGNPAWCNAEGTFSIVDGAIGDVDEIIITEPTTVDASILGTEISAESDDWQSIVDGQSYDGHYGVIELGQNGNAEAQTFAAPARHMTIDGDSDYTGGTMEMEPDGYGYYSFHFYDHEPDHLPDGTEMEMNPNGGWIDADNSNNVPVAIGGEWQWDPDSLEWSDEGGYDIFWYDTYPYWGDYKWDGPGAVEFDSTVDGFKTWGPITASVLVGDERWRFGPDGNYQIPVDDPHHAVGIDDNLNTLETHGTVWNFDTEIEEGTVTIETTYWSCEQYGWTGEDYDENGALWHNIECLDLDDENYVKANAGDEDPGSSDGFIMTRDAERNDLPDIEEGNPRQRSLAEVFQEADVDIEDGELQLGPGDFAFMNQLTMDLGSDDPGYCDPFGGDHQRPDGLLGEYGDNSADPYPGEYDLYSDDQTELNLAAWDIAKNYRHLNESANLECFPDTRDPNFNDVIGFVEVDVGGTHVEFDAEGLVEYEDPDGEVHLPEANYDFSDYEGEGGSVEAGSDYIVIS